ncbi:Uncharacterized protein Cob_v012603 [Colletotrichum orbiculare MAFF 240422]|uniref:Uncharacterized protein n=1 Tax=Colletotrichum orbiculare (strain 104-T / ATCC 96160 / CBS 514.97 / LARS 414 / MAFF 240422) TaxID=1213857 RepID=N4VHZ6_COLOR|nr:Uncharacterized protein Cob_v012603 [Colletotrichum orbiculare MAFF 240422]
MADTKQAPAANAPAAEKLEAQKTSRPTAPDEAEFKKNEAAALKAHKEAEDKLKAIKAKIDLATPNKNKDQQSPIQKRRAELIAQLNEIRQKQGVGKNARTSKLDQIKRLDEQMRSRINEQKNAKSKVSFKSVEEVDREIDRLESQVNSGSMKIVDEKKALAEISSLRKLKKNFSQFDDSQKQIDDLKAKIKEIKDSMDDPEAKAMSEQYNKLQAELDAIKAEGDEAYKNLSSLRDERTKLHALQNEKWTALKTIRDDYHQQRKAALAYEREARDKARERRKTEHERIIKERKKADAEKFLAEASDPAYLEEIRRANSLLQFLDPTHKSAEKAPLLASSGLTAQATRTVDDSGLKGMKLVSKKDREDEYFAGVKKGKKGKKNGAATDAGKFNCPPSVVEDCAFMGIDPPMSQADVPAVTEKVKAKLDHWKSDQAAQTQRNIEKAKKQLEKIEADEANGVSNGDSNGDGVEEVTQDLKETSVEEKA